MKGLQSLLADHPFFRSMKLDDLDLVAGCASNVRFEAGEYLFREGEPANRFYLIRHGQVALEHYAPGHGTVTILTAKDGEVLGFSWLLPPYRWMSDGRAVELTRAIAFDGECLRGKCEEDPRLGYDLMKRVTEVMVERLKSARVQVLDVYGKKPTATST
jgi:CRP-like cAMP-binding protein